MGARSEVNREREDNRLGALGQGVFVGVFVAGFVARTLVRVYESSGPYHADPPVSRLCEKKRRAATGGRPYGHHG